MVLEVVSLVQMLEVVRYLVRLKILVLQTVGCGNYLFENPFWDGTPDNATMCLHRLEVKRGKK